ncbi:MAG: DMT family transporter [Bacteroidota bacterium]
MPLTRNLQAHLSLFGSSLIFGVNYWIAKGMMPVFFDPFQIIFLRLSTAAIMFWAVSLFFPKEKVLRKDLILIAICAMLGVVINQILFFEGLQRTKPVETAILFTTSPILVLIMSHWLIKERITTTKSWGIAFGFIGAISIVMNGQVISLADTNMLGNLFIIINIISYSLYLVLVKPMMSKYHPMTVMKWVFLFGFIAVIPIAGPSISKINWEIITPFIWFSLSYVIIGSTFIAYLMITFSLKYLTPSVVGFYIYLQPFIATVTGILFYNSTITLVKVFAALMIFAGVYLVSKNPPRSSIEMSERY